MDLAHDQDAREWELSVEFVAAIPSIHKCAMGVLQEV